jgi:hypothetical protein
MSHSTSCAVCGELFTVGDYPFCPHEPVMVSYPFKPYYDLGLGAHVSSVAERETIRKRLGLEWKDQPTDGDLSARQDRAHAQRTTRNPLRR